MYDILVVVKKKNWENFGRPDNRCLMRNVGDLHFGQSKRKKKKRQTTRQENVFVVWVLYISCKMPCSPLLANKPPGGINVMKTLILYQNKNAVTMTTPISLREVMDSCYTKGVTYNILSIIIVALKG